MILVALAALAVGLVAGCGGPTGNAQGVIGTSVSDTPLESYESPGVKTSAAAQKGKVVLLSFFVGSSDACRQYMPLVQEIFDKYSSEGLEVMAVTSESRAEMDSFKKITNYGYPIYLDAANKLFELTRVYAVPSLVLVSRTGVIEAEFHPRESGELLAAIDRALAER